MKKSLLFVGALILTLGAGFWLGRTTVSTSRDVQAPELADAKSRAWAARQRDSA